MLLFLVVYSLIKEERRWKQLEPLLMWSLDASSSSYILLFILRRRTVSKFMQISLSDELTGEGALINTVKVPEVNL